ncbi:GFA family protein [Altererythrobacter sp.]|uniref:GFA family protein n=1 Tax=Altererythrobacter sp. TaxID=1872480 RepID=UPI003D0B1FBC
MSTIVREGGCGCGHVRYRVTGEPIFVNNCHCTQCQHQTGSTSVVNAFFETENIAVLEGELSESTVTAGSGGPHIIMRCSQCGTALWSHYPRLGRLGAGLRVGTLDEPGSTTPDAVIFTSEKMPWVALPEGIPHFETYYDIREVVPPERVARVDSLLERRKAGEG